MFILTEYKKLKKKYAKLERDYEDAEGKPLRQKRVLKSATSVQKKIDKFEEMFRG